MAHRVLSRPLGFAGGLHDRELGFVRFGWRDYDVKTGRWTAPDPIEEKGGDPDWYGYCLDDPVNGVDPAGLWTNGLGLGFGLSGFGLTGGGNAMVSEDENGERVLEFSIEHGASNDFGAGLTGTYQKTDAKSVGQLEGTSTKVGGGINIPTPLGAVGGSVEDVKGADYSGKNLNASWGPKKFGMNAPFKPAIGSVKHEKTLLLKVPKIQREYDEDLW